MLLICGISESPESAFILTDLIENICARHFLFVYIFARIFASDKSLHNLLSIQNAQNILGSSSISFLSNEYLVANPIWTKLAERKYIGKAAAIANKHTHL